MKNLNFKSVFSTFLCVSTVLLCLFFASCKKDADNLTVLLNQSGTLSVKVTDNNKGFPGAKVRIYSANSELYSGSTDANGICNIGKILQGQYECYVSAKNDKKLYESIQYFQVIAGDDKTLVVNPFLNVGDIKLTIVQGYYYDDSPVPDVNVALIPHPHYANVEYNFQDLIEEAYAIGKTNSEGVVELFNLPAAGDGYNFNYSVLVYYNSDKYDYPYSSVYITKGVKRSFTVRVNLPG